MADSTPLAGAPLWCCGGLWFSDLVPETLGVRMVFESPAGTLGDGSPGPLCLGQLGRGGSVRRPEQMRAHSQQTGEQPEREGS